MINRDLITEYKEQLKLTLKRLQEADDQLDGKIAYTQTTKSKLNLLKETIVRTNKLGIRVRKC